MACSRSALVRGSIFRRTSSFDFRNAYGKGANRSLNWDYCSTSRYAPLRSKLLSHELSVSCSHRFRAMEATNMTSRFNFGDMSNKFQKDSKYDPEYEVAVAEAVRTLLDELPDVFQRKLSYHIYTRDIELKIAGHSIRNIRAYRAIVWLSRCTVKIFFKYAFVDVWRIRHDEEGSIFIRWRLHFTGRVGGELDFEGMSEFRLDRKGKIYCHIVDPLIRNKKGKKSPAASLLEQLWPRPSLQPG